MLSLELSAGDKYELSFGPLYRGRTLSNWREREYFLPPPALGYFSIYLSETGMDSYEVGHGRTVERTKTGEADAYLKPPSLSSMPAACSPG